MKSSAVYEKKLVFHKIRNETGTSSEAAPYLGVIELNGVVSHEEFVEEIVANGCTASAETVDLVLKTGDAIVREGLGERGYSMHTAVSLVMPHLSGSLPAPDANPGEGNELLPRIDLCDGLRLAAADIVPKENREEISGLGGVRILSVLTEGIGFTQLKGIEPFSIAGVGFKPSAASSAAVKVVSAKTGAETAAAEVTVSDNQHITAKLGEVLPKGDYKVVVTVTDESAAGNRDASYNVRMLAAPQPEPIAQTSDGSVKIMTATDGGQSGTFTFGHEWKLGGSGLSASSPAGGRFAIDSAKVVYGDGEFDYSALEFESSADKTVMTLRKMPDGMEIPAGTYPDAKIRLSAFNGTTAEYLEVPVNLVVEG